MDLRQSFQGDLYSLLMNQILPDALFVHDHEGRFVEVNAKACESLGYTRAELLTMGVFDFEQDFDLAAAQSVWSRINTGDTTTLYGHQRHKSGHVFPVEVHFGLLEVDGQRLYFGTVRDMSAREHAEALLRDTAAELRTVFEAMAEGLVVQVPTGKIIDANPAAETILGLSRDQLLGKSSLDPNWRSIREDGTPFPGHEHPAMVTLRTGQSLRNQIMGLMDPKTGLRWLSVNSQPIFSAGSSTPSAAVATFVDVTEQRRLAEELRAAQTDLQAILDNVPARITSWLSDQTNRFANRMAEAHFGLASGAAAGKHLRDILGEAAFAEAQPFIEQALGGEPQLQEAVEPSAGGLPRYSQVHYIPKRQADRVVGLYVLAIDVSELRRSYERIRELALRLDAVREEERRFIAQLLHEGIAQDLFAMKLGLEHLKAQSKDRRGVTAACQELTTAMEKCMADTRQIANDLRPDALAHLRLADAIKDHARYFSELSRLRITVTEMEPFPLLDEPIRLYFFRAAQEALTNVSRHAHASLAEVVLRTDAEWIILELTDDGIGIDDQALYKMGALGLLGIREQVGALGGDLLVRKSNPAGTTLSVRVPLGNHSDGR
jgi:PAS domain S-box-containing protein